MAWTIRQMDDFAGWRGWGWPSPGGIPCLNPVFRLGPFGSETGPSRCSHRAGCWRDLLGSAARGKYGSQPGPTSVWVLAGLHDLDHDPVIRRDGLRRI